MSRAPASYDRLLPDEVTAIKDCALRHPKASYRKLSYMMLDQDIVAASESAMYRVLRETDLLTQAVETLGAVTGRIQLPTYRARSAMALQCHVCLDRVPALLLALLCRCLQPLRGPSPTAHHLLTELSSLALAIELEAAPAQCGSAKPRIVHGHCSEFCNTELRAVIKVHDLLDIRARARHPESNGIVKRFTGTVRQDSDDYSGGNYLAAERLMTKLIDEYNHRRLHAALAYFEPRDLHFGNPECRREGRREKLVTARRTRRDQNRSPLAA